MSVRFFLINFCSLDVQLLKKNMKQSLKLLPKIFETKQTTSTWIFYRIASNVARHLNEFQRIN